MTTTRDIVWHYTSAEGLLGIVTSREVWASSPVAMNDSSEVEYGVNCLDEAWASVRGEAPGVGVTDFLAEVMDHDFSTSVSEMGFAFCASRSRDMLSQWIQYAGPRGFAIGLDSSQKLARKRGDGLAVGTPLVPPLVETLA